MSNDLKIKPRHEKLNDVVDAKLSLLDTKHVYHFRNPLNTIAILDKLGYLRLSNCNLRNPPGGSRGKWDWIQQAADDIVKAKLNPRFLFAEVAGIIRANVPKKRKKK